MELEEMISDIKEVQPFFMVILQKCLLQKATERKATRRKRFLRKFLKCFVVLQRKAKAKITTKDILIVLKKLINDCKTLRKKNTAWI